MNTSVKPKHHRRMRSRLNTAESFAEGDDGPTTTTKALLVAVVAPCYFTIFQEDDGLLDSEELREQRQEEKEKEKQKQKEREEEAERLSLKATESLDAATNPPPKEDDWGLLLADLDIDADYASTLPGAMADKDHPLLRDTLSKNTPKEPQSQTEPQPQTDPTRGPALSMTKTSMVPLNDTVPEKSTSSTISTLTPMPPPSRPNSRKKRGHRSTQSVDTFLLSALNGPPPTISPTTSFAPLSTSTTPIPPTNIVSPRSSPRASPTNQHQPTHRGKKKGHRHTQSVDSIFSALTITSAMSTSNLLNFSNNPQATKKSSHGTSNSGNSSTRHKSNRSVESILSAMSRRSGTTLVQDDDAMPLREMTLPPSDSKDKSQEITPEQAAAVTNKQDNPREREVHIEELLRIQFQKLLEEYHFLNVPTYSHVMDKKIIQHAAHSAVDDGGNGRRGSIIKEVRSNGDPTSWIHVEVMARPASLGIILSRLEHIGVGTNVGTISVYKAELCKTASPYLMLPSVDSKGTSTQASTADESSNKPPETIGGAATNIDIMTADDATSVATKGASISMAAAAADDTADTEQIRERMIAEAKAEWKNAATRLRIEQVREQIGEQAALSFDFIALLTIAGILAGIGLITNNTVVIVASMLVSPIMGPVLGLTFGSRVRDWHLVVGSLVNESLALLGCLFIGVLIGLCSGFSQMAHDEWPTIEMESRGNPVGLLTGVAVAIPSGAGVCLSILGGNTSSLVGVAISASLLPPAVNAGICFMHSILLKTGAVTLKEDYDAIDFAEIGAISFALTVINIVCIWAAGIVMFHFKEVAPTESKGAFWARDIKVAREWNARRDASGKPPPLVDINVLTKGLRSALNMKRQKSAATDEKDKDSLRPIKTVKIKTPKRTVTGGSRYDRPSLNSAFAFKPSSKRAIYSPLQPAAFGYYAQNQQYSHGDSTLEIVEEDLNKNDDIGDNESDACYVDLADLGDLLGLGEEEGEQEFNIFWSRIPAR